MRGDSKLLNLVVDWQIRLQPLAMAVEAIEPTPELWRRIEATIAAEGQRRHQLPTHSGTQRIRWWESARFWRGWAIGSSAIAAGLAALLVLKPPPGPRLIAVLNTSSGQPGVLFTAELPGSVYAATAIQDISTQARAHELWLLPGPDSAPISLGLLEPDSTTRGPLPVAAVPLLRAGAGVAVSEEPPGGSPTGQPTGSVIYIGTLVNDRG
jgi:anti-sigma-K factor RskA